MPAKENNELVKALAVVCEVTGTTLSEGAIALFVKQLSAYPHRLVLMSLERCASECKFKLTLADVISRIDDGRPGAEEAWANFPKTEEEAGIVTEEMSAAWGSALELYDDDQVGARMAFKESYEREVRKARAENKPVKWRVTPGFDRAHTEGKATEALQRGVVSLEAALQFIAPEHHEKALIAAGVKMPALPAHIVEGGKAKLEDIIGRLSDGMGERKHDPRALAAGEKQEDAP